MLTHYILYRMSVKKMGHGLLAAALGLAAGAQAQDKIVNPDISYAGTPRTCTIGGMAVKGVEGYEDFVLTGFRETEWTAALEKRA